LNNRYRHGGSGVEALRKCNLETGVYLAAGFDVDRNIGHCVVLQVEDDGVRVCEEDCSNGLEALNWLHQLAYVRRFKLKTPFRIGGMTLHSTGCL
jgi:hypothetical protein